MAQTTRFAVEVHFGGRIDRKSHFGVKTPRKPHISEPECQISSQINIHEKLLNGQKISTDSLYKIWIGESNGDVIFASERHLAAKTTFGPILTW
jgi:hypothetical protein